MSRYTIKEMYDYWAELPPTMPTTHFLSATSWNAPSDEETPDTRPDYLKFTNDNGLNLVHSFVRKYGDWVYCVDCSSVGTAWSAFTNDNVVYEITHRSSLLMTEKAFNADFSPIENYDRYEDGTHTNAVNSHAESDTISKVSPDDGVDDLATSGASSGTSDAQSSGSTIDSVHVHGNIGVTRSDEMTASIVKQYSNADFAMYDTFIARLLNNTCLLIV